jgi:hypothetical protein
MSSIMAASWSSRDMPSKESNGSFDGMVGTDTLGARGALECGMTLTWALAAIISSTLQQIPNLMYSGSLGA